MKNKFYFSSLKNFLRGNKTTTNVFVLLSFVLSVLVILFFNYFIDAYLSFNEDDFRVGEPSKKEYVLKSDLNYYNDFETKIVREVEEKLVLPVYKVDNEITTIALSNFTLFYKQLADIIELSNDKDILQFEVEQKIPDVFSSEEIKNIAFIDYSKLFILTLEELKRIMKRGYISSNSPGFSNGSGLVSVIGYDDDNNTYENISAISVLKSINTNILIDNEFKPYFEKLIKYFVRVNCYYDNEQTKYNRKIALEKVDPVIDLYRNGETLIGKGLVVTTDLYKKIIQAEELIKRNTFSNILMIFGYVLLLYIASFVLFTEKFINKILKESDIILISCITIFYVIIASFLKYILGSQSVYYYPLILPTVLISMLISFLLGNRVGLYLSILLSFFILLISDFSIYSFSITLIMSILGTVIVHDVEKRIDLLKSSGELAVIQTLLVLYMLVVGLVHVDDYFKFISISIASSLISGILTLALLPLSEHFLKISTCFQLTELCDLNAPVLKSMLIKAPGTYAHSIAVANMAESAAQHIGANPLLAKAGGYYHDIGKIDQPHYFIENQKGGKNLHDDMKPSLSVAVIKSHVKLGIEKGKNIGLPTEIIDIIEQHHGKGSIAFFLDKAKKESKNGVVLTEDFGYSGPNPQNPEAAIVMLGDSVEAAVRSLKNPTISQLDKFVWELILNKLKEGMLDACGLTLSDLTTIKNSFINTLMGHYHSRIEYPSGDEE